ncbi:hypothetical protein C8R44DRAFT_759113 [Mycena epipterygia]|nr:hypothetical protein C8R44DRAFT_759113 [Mycena epipterygia]
MHRGLEIFEITELICGQLGPEALGLSWDATRALNALARTSKIFLDPALSVLWRHQNTILNLLRCMPDDLWNIEELERDMESEYEYDMARFEVSLQRPITKADWERPLLYSHRVKSFTMDLGGLAEDSDLFETVSLCLPGECIFPNLTKLRWDLQPIASFHHVRLFLTPSIENLYLGSIRTISHLSVLPNLTVKCPCLTNVGISIDGILLSASSLPIVSTFVGGLMYIESLKVPGLDETAVAHLAQLPGLRRLTLGHPRDTYPSFQPSGEPHAFPALTKLTASTMECATAFITAMSHNRPFMDVSIFAPSSHPPPTTIIARQFYSALEKHCSRSSLQKIDVLHWGDAIDTMGADLVDVYSVGSDLLRPLFSFTNLVRVSLQHPVGFDLDDATVLQMARAWSRIECLILRASPARHMRSRVTLEGIYAFAKHCPSLKMLQMTFDATFVPKINKKRPSRMAQQSLYCFNVDLSLLRRPRGVAKFLSAIFPRLVSIQTTYEHLLDLHDEEDDEEEMTVEPEVYDSHTFWKEVEDALPDYRAGQAVCRT